MHKLWHPSVLAGQCFVLGAVLELSGDRACTRAQVIVLVGTGWSYMTPFLRDREKRILMIVIPLQARCPQHSRALRDWVFPL